MGGQREASLGTVFEYTGRSTLFRLMGHKLGVPGSHLPKRKLTHERKFERWDEPIANDPV